MSSRANVDPNYMIRIISRIRSCVPISRMFGTGSAISGFSGSRTGETTRTS